MTKKISIATKPMAAPKLADADAWVDKRSTEVASDEKIKRLTIDIPNGLHRQIKIQCATRGTKMADEIRELLERHFAKSGHNS
jgi:ParG